MYIIKGQEYTFLSKARADYCNNVSPPHRGSTVPTSLSRRGPNWRDEFP